MKIYTTHILNFVDGIVIQGKYILWIFFWATLASLSAQGDYRITNLGNDHMEGLEDGVLLDSVSIVRSINKIIASSQGRGYVTANPDRVLFVKDTCYIDFHRGELFEFGNIHQSEYATQIVSAAGLSAFRMNQTIPDSLRMNKFMSGILHFMVRNGYPFAAVYLDSVVIVGGKINANLMIEAGKEIKFGEAEVPGRNGVSPEFLKQYLQIKKGKPYDHDKVLQIRPKIRDLPYVEEFEAPTVSFINDEAIVNIPLVPKKSSFFDFIIGLAPITQNGLRKWNVNGEFNADLFNRLGQGERIQMKIKRLKAEDQSLFLAASYPYFLNTPLGLEGELSIVRNRNLSVDVATKFGVQYLISGNETGRINWNLRSSRLSSIDTTRLKNTRRLPPQLDYNFKGGGLTYQIRKVDYRFNPRKGWELELGLDAGVRTIVKNSTIQAIKTDLVDFSTAYDSLGNVVFQMNSSLVLSAYFPVSTWAAVKTGFTGGMRYNSGQVLDNELFRIGGNKLLRGFDELSILTDIYGVVTSEFRVILDQNSFLSFPFIDVSRQRVYMDGKPLWDTAVGIGLGMNFATKAGMFNLAFSAGRRLESAFDFGKAKVHFGYVSLF